MKKYLILLMLVVVLPLSAQVHYLQATKFTASDGYSTSTQDSNVRIIIDLDRNHCEIYSAETQVIDYVPERKYTDSNNYEVLECYGTDSYYRKIRFILYTHPVKNIVLIQVTYSDISYVYTCYVRAPF